MRWEQERYQGGEWAGWEIDRDRIKDRDRKIRDKQMEKKQQRKKKRIQLRSQPEQGRRRGQSEVVSETEEGVRS